MVPLLSMAIPGTRGILGALTVYSLLKVVGIAQFMLVEND